MNEPIHPRSLRTILEMMKQYNVTNLTDGSLHITRELERNQPAPAPTPTWSPPTNTKPKSNLESQLDDLLNFQES